MAGIVIWCSDWLKLLYCVNDYIICFDADLKFKMTAMAEQN